MCIRMHEQHMPLFYHDMQYVSFKHKTTERVTIYLKAKQARAHTHTMKRYDFTALMKVVRNRVIADFDHL